MAVKAPETPAETPNEAPESKDTDEDAKAEQEVIERVKAAPKAPTTRKRNVKSQAQKAVELALVGDK